MKEKWKDKEKSNSLRKKERKKEKTLSDKEKNNL